MRKAFTLIEILVTLIIIGIALSMVANMGSGFSDRVRFANTKEETVSAISNVVQEAATTNAVRVGTWREKYGMITVTILSWTSIWREYSSGVLALPITGEKVIRRGTLTATWFSLIVVPYAVWCELPDSKFFSLTSADNPNMRACYETDPTTCKTREIVCQP